MEIKLLFDELKAIENQAILAKAKCNKELTKMRVRIEQCGARVWKQLSKLAVALPYSDPREICIKSYLIRFVSARGFQIYR